MGVRRVPKTPDVPEDVPEDIPVIGGNMNSRLFLVLILVHCLAGFALAQTDTARVVGTITDPSGAVVANANVVVTNVDTGRTVTVQTSGSGEYVVNAVPAGKYHIEVKAPGFKSATADFTLEVSQVQEISLKLEAGSTGTTVDVTGEVPLVDTETSSTGEVIQGRQVTELPLNGRNFTQLALLTPGVTRGAYGDISSGGGSGTNAETYRNSETGGAALSANGLRPQANNFILDGVDNNEGLVNSIIFFPPAEAIQEFRVNTSVATAEFGRGGGAIVQTSIKPALSRAPTRSTDRLSGSAAAVSATPILGGHQTRRSFTSETSLAAHWVGQSGRTSFLYSATTRGAVRRIRSLSNTPPSPPTR